jgi:hypothetical protein
VEGIAMTVMEWMLWMTLAVIYIACVFTVCSVTFRKGHTALGIFGIFLPFLWLFGAILPSKAGSPYALEERARVSA